MTLEEILNNIRDISDNLYRMKVVCIDDTPIGEALGRTGRRSSNLTKNKIYDVLQYDIASYIIINDKGEEDGYYKHRFKTLNEVRDEKISSLLL